MDILKTKKLRALIAQDQRFEILNREGLPLICFRLRGRCAQDTENLCHELNGTKQMFLVFAVDRDITFIRIAFGIFTQTDEHIQKTWKLLKETTDKFFPD